jgi:hypothetical protein
VGIVIYPDSYPDLALQVNKERDEASVSGLRWTPDIGGLTLSRSQVDLSVGNIEKEYVASSLYPFYLPMNCSCATL